MEQSQFVAHTAHASFGPARRPSAVAAAQPPGADKVWPTLLDAVGGASGIQRIVDRLVRRLQRDPLIAPSLDGVDMIRLKRAQTRFFTDAFSAVRVHEPLTPLTVRVSGEQFTRVVLHIHQTIVSLELPETVTEQVMLAVLARGVMGDDPAELTVA